MLRPIRTDAGLGDPPSEYTNNDPEAANFLIKHGLHFNPVKPHEFVEKVKGIIETQQRNEERAIFGKGPFRVAKEFAHLTVDDSGRSRLSHAQMTKKILTFKNATMSDQNDVENSEPEIEETGQSFMLTTTAEQSGITTVPLPILEGVFEKASSLLATPGNVIEKPGASNGSYIVAGTCNKVHSVEPGKGGSLTCDRSCVNFATKICEHVVAVAQAKGMLPEFLAWFKRKKKRTGLMEMAEQGGPKTAGKKPSARKRTNAKRMEVESYVNILEEDRVRTIAADREPAAHAPAADRESAAHAPAHPPIVSQPLSPFTQPPYRQSPFPETHFSGMSPFHRPQYAVTNPPNCHGVQHMINAAQYLPPAGLFYLKWVQGTRVSKCYGCNGVIENPPRQRPDDLVVFCRDVRQYRDKFTGLLQQSNTVQNVHFHLRLECILARYPSFHIGLLHITETFGAVLQEEHVARLRENFKWTG